MKKTIVILAATACMLNATVQAAVTGWAKGNGITEKVLYVGTNVNDGGACDARGVSGISLDADGNTVIDSVTVSEYDPNMKQFRISADAKDGQTAKIKTLTANADSTITVGNSGYTPLKQFKKLTIDSLVADNAKIVVSEGEALTLGGYTGSISNITVNGTLELTSSVMGLNSFTLDADSMIGGTYNIGQAGIKTLTITLSDADAITEALTTSRSYEKQLTTTMWNAEKIGSAVLIAEGYENGGLVFYNVNTKTYYSETSWSNGQVTYNDANIIELEDNLLYTVAKVNGNNITGLYATINIPEPTTATLSLLALAGLCARRRRA